MYAVTNLCLFSSITNPFSVDFLDNKTMKNIGCGSNGHVFKLKTFKGIKTGVTDGYNGYECGVTDRYSG